MQISPGAEPISKGSTGAASPKRERAEALATAQPLPDLVVDRFDASNRFPLPGREITVDFTVKNRGTAPSGSFLLKMVGDGYTDSVMRMAGLPPGAAHAVSFGPVNPGYRDTAFYEVELDTKKEVKESNERNNGARLVVWPRVPGPPRDPFPMPPRRP